MRRKGAAALAILCAIAIALTGTFAFQTMAQQGWGQAIAKDQFPAGRLHIDQEVIGALPGNNFGAMVWKPGDAANKEIYVENFDDLIPIFVRVRLSEYMETGPGAELHPNDPAFAARTAQPLIAGADRLDPTTWTALIPNAAAGTPTAMFRDYWTLTQDGGGKWFMPTFNQDPVSREPDVKGDAWGLIPALPELPNSTRRGLPAAALGNPDSVDQPHAYAPEAGLSDYFELNTTHTATVKTYDWGLGLPVMDTAPITQTARETLDAEIMTMAEWNAANQPVGDIWVLDTDGWAYWASPLEAGEATGLLMNEMKYTNPVVGTMYYAVYADADFATLFQLPMAWGGVSNAPMSPEAEGLVNVITSVPEEPDEPDDPVPHEISHMQSVGLTAEPHQTHPFLTFSSLPRNQIASVEVINLYISDSPSVWMAETNAAGGFRGQSVIEAVDLTYAASDFPVVAFYTASDTAGRFAVYFAGHNGVAARGSLRSLFQNVTNASSMDLRLLDTSHVTSMNFLFWGASTLTSLDLSGWDTSHVTNMSYMFSNARALTSLGDVSGWDTSHVTNMNSMFSGAIALTSLDLSGWDTSKVTDMFNMFFSTAALTTVDMRKADFGNVTNRTNMFRDSGINEMTLGSTAARDFIQNAPGWTREPPRTIVVAN